MRPIASLPFALCCWLSVISCGPPPVENIYRKEGHFPGGLPLPVAFLVSEFGGQPRIMASGWLIDGAGGVLFSARHFTDVFMNDIVELGASECRAFLGGIVHECAVVQVSSKRDAVILQLKNYVHSNLPRPYKIATEKAKVGERVFIQGFHPHPADIAEINRKEGFPDTVISILKSYYEMRVADPGLQREVVFDNLEAVVVDVNARVKINTEEKDPLAELKYRVNDYIRVQTVRNHRFSFGGLSGGVVVRVAADGAIEAIGIITAERPVRVERSGDDQIWHESEPKVVADTLSITPIDSVRDLYEYARSMK